MLSQSKQDQETWLRRTQIAIPLSPYQLPDFYSISINFNTFPVISMIAEAWGRSPKITKSCRRSPKIAKDRQRSLTIAEDPLRSPKIA